MMAGIRKAPPISTSSPLETGTSRFSARVFEQQHDGRRIVVDDKRALCARSGGSAARRKPAPRFPLPAAPEIVFQRTRVPRGPGHGLDGFAGQRRTPKIGMENGSGKVEDGRQSRLHPPCGRRSRPRLRPDPPSSRFRDGRGWPSGYPPSRGGGRTGPGVPSLRASQVSSLRLADVPCPGAAVSFITGSMQGRRSRRPDMLTGLPNGCRIGSCP